MSEVSTHPKITADHLGRRAAVYVRQSTYMQVRYNTESQQLQYALVERARALGWTEIDVVDHDLGMSASMGAAPRAGFDRLLASVARGEVGVVFAREVSRLSRTDKDFCHLLELCQVFNTLLADDDQVYDSANADDQLVLGIKGILSVVELRVLRLRLTQGKLNKARRGELRRVLPSGYVYDDDRPVLDPDLRVRDAVACVFAVFRRTSSIRQTVQWFHTEGIAVPVRRRVGSRWQILWRLPTPSFIHDVLTNPWYAGAYVWGRYASTVRYREGRLEKHRTRRLRLDECAVFLRDHHDTYITWEQFEEHGRIMSKNSRVVSGTSASPIRSGAGLLAGLLRCGRCGRHLHVRYSDKAGTAARYLCPGDFATGGQYCLGFGGRGVDEGLSAELLRIISPLGLRASLLAIESRAEAHDARRVALERELQQTEYEATRAFEQYNEVDARNRLVAAELERRWNAKLQDVSRVQGALQALPLRAKTLSDDERRSIQWLGEHFESVWHSAHCPLEQKKQIIRALIEEIVVGLDDATQMLGFVLHWKGGVHTRFEMLKPRSSKGRPNDSADIEIIRTMAQRYSDDQIANVLTRTGRTTGKGLRWNRERVKSARTRAGIAGHERPVVDPELLNLQAAAVHCAVSDTTIRRLAEAGLITNLQSIPCAPWEIRRADLDAEPVQRIVRHLHATGRLVLHAPRLDQQPGLF